MRCKVIFYFECFSLRFNFNFGFCSFQKVQNAVEFTKIHICGCDSSAPDPAGGLWPLPQTSLWGPHVLVWHMKWLQVWGHLSEESFVRNGDVQIPKFDANPNPSPSYKPNPMPIRFEQMTIRQYIFQDFCFEVSWTSCGPYKISDRHDWRWSK